MKTTWRRAFLLGLLLFFFVDTLAFAGSQVASGVTVQTIIDRARQRLSESAAYFWSDAELLNHINEGIVEIAAISRGMEGTERITVLTGITAYSISTSYIFVEAAVYSGTTTEYADSPYRPLERIPIGKLGKNEDSDHVGPLAYCVWNDTLYLDPVPTSGASGYTVMLYLLGRPTALSATSAIPTPAQYDKALVLYVVGEALEKWPQFSERAKAIKADCRQILQFYRQEFSDKDVAKPPDLTR